MASEPNAASSSSVRGVWITLVVVAVAASGALVGIWLIADPPKDTLWFEAAKASIGVLSASVVGGVLTIATTTFQHNRQVGAESERVKAEEAAKELQRGRDELERSRANERDERGRKDDVLREWLSETLVTYNAVKKIRRRLQAYRPSQAVPVATYEELMMRLIDEQLNFESLQKRAPCLDDDRIDVKAISDLYKEIQEYLNGIIREYQSRPHSAQNPTNQVLGDVPDLEQFLTRDVFRNSVAKRADEIVTAIQNALLVPLILSESPDASKTRLATSK